MTNIEQKALELVNEVARERGYGTMEIDPKTFHAHEALCRAIERHEQFRQEVSDAVVAAKHVYGGHREAFDQLDRFIIAKPDPLVEAIRECWHSDKILEDRFRAALDKYGLEIREKSDG